MSHLETAHTTDIHDRPNPDRTTQVLIIDDSEADLEVYARFLRKDPEWTFQVSTTSDKEEFFNCLMHQSVDLVLMDYSMPQIDGLSLMQEMKVRLPDYFDNLCIVMMTGQGSETIAVEAMKNGASDYISKQLITDDFLRKTLKDNLYRYYLSKELTKAKAQIERDLIFKISLKIRQSLDLDAIVQTAVEEIRTYLQCDRVFIYRLASPSGVLGESVNPTFPKALDALTLLCNITSTLSPEQLQTLQVWSDLEHGEDQHLSPLYKQHLHCLQVQSRLYIPLFITSHSQTPWGLLIADFCDRCHTWQAAETQLLEEISLQLSLGIQQSLLLAELKIQRDLATQSERAKSSFLANMSHEIRTPMTAIIGASDLLAKQSMNADAQYYLKMIQSSGKHLLDLINNILDLSKLESQTFILDSIQFSLCQLLDDLLEIFQPLLKQKNLTIALEREENLPDIYRGDPIRLKQVLCNLIGNAIKFTPQGRILVSIQNSITPSPLPHQTIQLYFKISDGGIGIASKDQGKLFQPFSQVEDSATRNFQGSGLGLSICKRLVELMGGKIGVNSRLGEGATFWFTVNLRLEVTQEKALMSPSPLPTPPIRDPSLEHIKILVAEDNAVNQQLISLMLAKIGCRCDVVENGELVIQILNEKAFDIILMDCQMPVLDGYQTTQAIRQQDNSQLSNIIIIGLTAYALEDDRQKCLNAGMNDYLAKPYTLLGLKGILLKWMRFELSP